MLALSNMDNPGTYTINRIFIESKDLSYKPFHNFG